MLGPTSGLCTRTNVGLDDALVTAPVVPVPPMDRLPDQPVASAIDQTSRDDPERYAMGGPPCSTPDGGSSLVIT